MLALTRADPECADPGRADPGRADPGRADPVRADPGRADPVRADPVRADPGRQPRGAWSTRGCLFGGCLECPGRPGMRGTLSRPAPRSRIRIPRAGPKPPGYPGL